MKQGCDRNFEKEKAMSVSTIVVAAAAVVLGFFWLMKRRARMRSGDFE